jgi:hypothetical protein
MRVKKKAKGSRQKLTEARCSDWAELEARELEAREQDRLAEEKEAEKAKRAKQRAEKKAEKAEKAEKAKAKKEKAKAKQAKKPAGTRQKVCFSLRPILVESSLIFLCRNKVLPRFLLNLSALRAMRGTRRRVWGAVVGLRGSGSLVGGSAVGRVVWSGFGASLMELGSSLGALDVFLIPDDSLLFSTILRCLVSSLVVIGRLVVEISSSRLSSPRLHALMRGVRKYVVSEGYVTCSKPFRTKVCRRRRSCHMLYTLIRARSGVMRCKSGVAGDSDDQDRHTGVVPSDRRLGRAGRHLSMPGTVRYLTQPASSHPYVGYLVLATEGSPAFQATALMAREVW